jgi:hypothetical protein
MHTSRPVFESKLCKRALGYLGGRTRGIRLVGFSWAIASRNVSMPNYQENDHADLA